MIGHLTLRQLIPSITKVIKTPEEKASYELKSLIVAGVRISWEIPHAEQQALKRDVPKFEAERVVRGAKVVRIDAEASGQERWRVSGFDSDQRPVDVVVKHVRDALRVVTVIRTDE
jgi:uncharacterized DUF497 family protein